MAAQQSPAFAKGKLYDLPITDIQPDPNQPRKYMDPQAHLLQLLKNSSAISDI
jgi:hypothetical protein